MGKYQLPSTKITLNFADTDFDGAEVRCNGNVTMGFLLRMQRVNSNDVEGAEAALIEFGDKVLISWNLQDEAGADMSCDGSGMMQITVQFAKALMNEWAEAVAQPPAPLSPESSNGSTDQTTPEIGSMMEAPESLNLASLSTRN